MRIQELLIVLYCVMAFSACKSAWAVDISANGTNEGNAGVSVTTNADSTITGPGSYTITGFGAVTVENNNTVIVSGSDTNEGKLIIANGIYTNNMGASTVFASGGFLQNDGTVMNAGAMSFEAGSGYSGNGTVMTFNSLSIHSETDNIIHLLDNVNMVNGSLRLHGSTMGLGGSLDFTGGLAGTRVILATDAGGIFAGNVNVGLSELEITTSTTFMANVSAAGIAVKNGITTFTGGAATSTGTVSIASGGGAAFGTTATLTAAGDIDIAGGSSLHFTLATGGGTPIVSTGGDINVSGTGTVAVTFSGSRADILGRHLLAASTGTITNYASLDSLFYLFGHKSIGSGEAVYVAGYRSVNDILTDAMGETSFMSKNKYNGGLYTDSVFDTQWGYTNADLNDYIQSLAAPGLDNGTRLSALGQLYGEYGAYASTTLAASAGMFLNELGNRLRILSSEDFCVLDEYGEYIYVGSLENSGRMWISALGDWTAQSDRDNIHGYDRGSSGVAIGYDYHNDNLSIGFAGAYAYSTLKVNELDTKFQSDTLHLGVYGDYVFSGMHLRAQAAYGRGWNEYDVNMAMGGSKKADYMNSAFSASLEIGYDAVLGSATITPAIGLDYTHIRQDEWTEDVVRGGNAPVLANSFDRARRNIVDIPFSLRAGTEFGGNGTVFRPELRAAWIYQANDRTADIKTGYAGSGQYVRMYGAAAAASRLSLGAGLTAKFGERIDASAQYSFDYGSNYRNHTVAGTLGVAF